jgi:hypothetical protein
MVRVEKVACADSRDVEDLLIKFWGRGNEVKWHKLFTYQWGRHENYCGLALKDNDKVVGFIGMIFSQRRIDDKVEKFCNLAAWFVREEYRGQAIALLFPLFSMRNYTITDLTPAKKVYRIQNKLGLKDLDVKGRILLPIGRRLFQPKYTPLQMTHDLATIESELDGQNRKIFHDHKPYQCYHFLATEADRYCYLIYTKLKRRLPYAHIHYISNLDLFELVYRDIRKAILSHSSAYFLLIDSRLVNNRRLPLSLCLPFRTPKQYMSSRLEPEQIDNLYSELVLLNLRTLPRLKYLLRDIRRKMFGSSMAG